MTFTPASEKINVEEVRNLSKLTGEALAKKRRVTQNSLRLCVEKMIAFSW